MKVLSGSWALALGILVATGAGARGQGATAKVKEHVWEGPIKIGTGAEVRLVFHVKPDDVGKLTATFDSPDQGAKGLKVNAVTLEKDRLAFDMSGIGVQYAGKLNAAGTECVGTWTQGGVDLPVTLTKKEKASEAPTIVGKEELWEGKLNLQAGIGIRLVFHVGKDAAGKLIGTMDSPDQGAKGIKVTSVSREKDKLVIEVKSLGGKFEGTLNKEGDSAEGTWEQLGNKIPLTIKKTDKVTEIRHPQTPVPPFPYQEEQVTYVNKEGGGSLAGTLTKPEGPGPFGAVIMISGSGAQDRDETLLGHKPFLVIADALTRRGVAVLRVDDRGVGGSSGDTAKATTEDFAGDVLAGVAYLKTRKDIDPARIGLIGHSEGGVIAPMVAAKSKDVAFIVLLAGTGLPGDEILQLQAGLIGKALGGAKDNGDLEKQLGFQKRLIEVAKTETDDTKSTEKMKAIIKELLAALPEKERKELDGMKGVLDAQLKALRGPWFRFFLKYDPRPALTQVRCPVLALIGEKDLQVPPRENLSEIGKALVASGHADVTLKELPGLNHLFQTCKTGAPSEYATIEETVSPTALKVIGDWVVARTRKD